MRRFVFLLLTYVFFICIAKARNENHILSNNNNIYSIEQNQSNENCFVPYFDKEKKLLNLYRFNFLQNKVEATYYFKSNENYFVDNVTNYIISSDGFLFNELGEVVSKINIDEDIVQFISLKNYYFIFTNNKAYKYDKSDYRLLEKYESLDVNTTLVSKPIFSTQDDIVYYGKNKRLNKINENFQLISSSPMTFDNVNKIVYTNSYYVINLGIENTVILDSNFSIVKELYYTQNENRSRLTYNDIVIFEDKYYCLAQNWYGKKFTLEIGFLTKEVPSSVVDLGSIIGDSSSNHLNYTFIVELLGVVKNKLLLKKTDYNRAQYYLYNIEMNKLSPLFGSSDNLLNFDRINYKGKDIYARNLALGLEIYRDYDLLEFLAFDGFSGKGQSRKVLLEDDFIYFQSRDAILTPRSFLRQNIYNQRIDTLFVTRDLGYQIIDFIKVNNEIYFIEDKLSSHSYGSCKLYSINLESMDLNLISDSDGFLYEFSPIEILYKEPQILLVSKFGKKIKSFVDLSFTDSDIFNLNYSTTWANLLQKGYGISEDYSKLVSRDIDNNSITVVDLDRFENLDTYTIDVNILDITCLDIENDGSYIYFGTKENGAFYLNTLTEEISEAPSNKRLPKIYDEESNSLKYYSIEKIEIYHDTRELMIISEGGLVEFIKLPNTIGSVNTAEEGIGAISYLSSDVINVFEEYVVDELRVYDLMGRELEVEQLSTHQYKIKNANERVIFSRIIIGEKTYTEKYILER